MRALVKKIHIYLGLLNFSNLIVFGVAGLGATFHGPPPRKMASEQVRVESFVPVPGSTDRQLADQVFARLRLPLADPVPDWALHRDAAGDLPLEFWTVNGTCRVLVQPREGRLRVEILRNSLPMFLDDMHTMTEVNQSDWRMRIWTWYNHFAMWSLLTMAISGVYLWLASRARYRIAQYCFAGGAAIFVLLYAMAR